MKHVAEVRVALLVPEEPNDLAEPLSPLEGLNPVYQGLRGLATHLGMGLTVHELVVLTQDTFIIAT